MQRRIKTVPVIGTTYASAMLLGRCHVGLTINIKTPPPANLLREYTTQDGTDRRSQSPHHSNHPKIRPSIPHAEEIADADVGQDD